jgi:hypothetical protein
MTTTCLWHRNKTQPAIQRKGIPSTCMSSSALLNQWIGSHENWYEHHDSGEHYTTEHTTNREKVHRGWNSLWIFSSPAWKWSVSALKCIVVAPSKFIHHNHVISDSTFYNLCRWQSIIKQANKEVIKTFLHSWYMYRAFILTYSPEANEPVTNLFTV